MTWRTPLTLVALPAALLALPSLAAAQCEVQTLISTDFGIKGPFGLGDAFGSDLAVEDDLLVVGAPHADVLNAEDGGAAYLYRRVGDVYEPETKFVTPGTAVFSHFGSQVFIGGGTVSMLGGPGLSDFTFHADCWAHKELLEHAYVDPLLPVTADLDDDVFVVASSGALGQIGEATVYRRDGAGSWQLEATLANPLPGVDNQFGTAVALDGDRLAISSARTAHVFERDGGSWGLAASVDAVDPGDGFGARLDLSGDTLVVSAPHDDPVDPQTGLPVSSNGAVHVFTHDGFGGWSQRLELVPSRMAPGIQVGRDVALQGDVLAVSSRHSDPHTASGDVTLFERVDGQWVECGDPAPAGLAGFDDFGGSLVLHGDLVLGASLGHDELPYTDVGKVTAFTLDPIIDRGSGLAGTAGLVPRLSVGPGLCGDALTTVALGDARPHSITAMLFGLSAMTAPFKTGVLVPAPDLVLLGLPTDATGALVFDLAWPAGFVGVSTWWQYAVADAEAPAGWSLSNAMEVTSGGL